MTMFKLNPLAAACAAALGLSAGNALAATPFDRHAGCGDLPVRCLGAGQHPGGIAAKFFDAGSPSSTSDDNGTPADFTDDGKAYRAYFGVVKVGRSRHQRRRSARRCA